MEMKADVRSLAEEPLKERIGVDPHVEKDKTSNTLFPLITLDCDPAIRRLPGVPQERHIVLDVKGVRTLFGAISAELERPNYPTSADDCTVVRRRHMAEGHDVHCDCL